MENGLILCKCNKLILNIPAEVATLTVSNKSNLLLLHTFKIFLPPVNLVYLTPDLRFSFAK